MRDRHLLTSCVGLAASCFILGATAAIGATPEMKGTWRMEGSGIVAGSGGHHPADADPPADGQKPRLRPFVGTLQVMGQEDVRFWGTIESEDYREDVIGIFTGQPDGHFLYVDSDGFMEGHLGEDGTGQYCYWHIAAESRVAACGTMTRE